MILEEYKEEIRKIEEDERDYAIKRIKQISSKEFIDKVIADNKDPLNFVIEAEELKSFYNIKQNEL